jgi:hypothetical protein
MILIERNLSWCIVCSGITARREMWLDSSHGIAQRPQIAVNFHHADMWSPWSGNSYDSSILFIGFGKKHSFKNTEMINV